MKETPKQFAERWCAEHDVSLTAIMAATRSRHRRDLCVALKRQFPDISSTSVGMLLGLDHTSVLYAWQRVGIRAGNHRPPPTPREIETFKALRAQGMLWADIARLTGRSATFVKRCVDPDYSAQWTKRRKERERRMLERRNEVRRKAMAEFRTARLK